MLDYHLIWQNLPLYLSGIALTLKVLLVSLACGLALAIPLALMRVSNLYLLRFPAWLFTYVIRGTPMLVQLFPVYYGLAQFELVRQSLLWPYLSSATFCTCLAFAINTSAYSAELLAGSLRATPGRSRSRTCHGHVASRPVPAHPAALGPAPVPAAIQ